MHLQDMCSDVANTIGVRTANLCRVQMLGALKQAVRWQLIPRNPAEALVPAKETKKDMIMWTWHEAAKFLDAAREHRLYPLFYLTMSTGMRRGEVLALRWQDVGPTSLTVKRSLSIVDGEPSFSVPKSDKSVRRVALSADTLNVLEGHRARQKAHRDFLGVAWQEGDLVFPSEVGTPIHPRNLQRAWADLQKQAGVPRVRFHDLRHLHASIAIKQGMDAKVLADRLGHARASFTLDVYTHLFDEQRENSAVSILDLTSSEQTPGETN